MRKVLSEDSEEQINYALEVAEQWKDLFVWEETPFKPSDDVVLLSFGFHFGSDRTSMYKVEEDGSTWTVKIDSAVPVWYHNGVRIGGRSYDDVVSQFGRKRK